jgi:hypothetical protein
MRADDRPRITFAHRVFLVSFVNWLITFSCRSVAGEAMQRRPDRQT